MAFSSNAGSGLEIRELRNQQHDPQRNIAHERNPIYTSPFSYIQFITLIYWRKRRRLRIRSILSDTRTIGIIRCFGRFI